MVNLDVEVTQSEFGQLIGISQQAVSDLMQRGIVSADATAKQMLLDYCAYMREMAAGRAAAGDYDLAGERARLARAQAERVEMMNAEKRRELAPAYLIEDVLARTAVRVIAIFEAIPGAIKRRVPTLSSAEIDMVKDEIAKARNMVASMNLNEVMTDESNLESETADTEIDA